MSGIKDLDLLVIQWGKKNGKRLNIKNADKATVKVHWERVKFTADDPVWIKSKQCPTAPSAVTIYATTFQNNSEDETEHTLKMERSTKATCQTTVTNGYTTSFNLGITLALPYEVATTTVGFGREVKVETADQTTFEQEQLWSVDTKINMQPQSKTKVKVEVKETRWKGTFTLPVIIKGTLVLSFYDQNTPGNHLGSLDVDVAELLPEFGAERVTSENGRPRREVKWVLEGESDFVFGVEQNVVVQPCT